MQSIKKFIKRFYPVSNRWFFEEAQKRQASDALLRKEIGLLAAKVEQIGSEVRKGQEASAKAEGEERAARTAAAGSLAAVSTGVRGLEPRLQTLENKINNIRGVLDRMEDRQCYIAGMLEEGRKAAPLDALRLYFIEVNYKREFSFGSWPKRLHCCVMAESGGHRGWGEACVSMGARTTEEMVKNMARSFAPWHGKSLDEAKSLVKVRRGRTPDRVLEALDMALLDVSARREGISALTALEAAYGARPKTGKGAFNPVKDSAAVPGLKCILQKDPRAAQDLARVMAKTHLKVKLFGDNVHDYNLIKAVREVIGKDCYLVGDVNMGFSPLVGADLDLGDLTRALGNLREAGLDACEDPANLSWAGLEKLQAAVGEMAIIPDEPMRPAYEIIKHIKPVRGHIYNLHPNCMGSVVETYNLAKKLSAGGAGVMIGDSSLIGPACAAWQQIACAVKAQWCEALEKPEESAAFTSAIVSSPMGRLEDGRLRIERNAGGFGLEVDLDKLKANSFAVMDV